LLFELGRRCGQQSYAAQRAFLAKLDKDEVPLADAKAKTKEFIGVELVAVK